MGKFVALFLMCLRQVMRTKLLLMFLVFTAVIQFVVLKSFQGMQLTYSGMLVMPTPGPRMALFASLYFQLFIGLFLSAVYGIWMIPYGHSGQRGHMTFALPISRWTYPACYALVLFLLVLVQHLIMISIFAYHYGMASLGQGAFPWAGILSCLALELLAFEVCTFFFAVSSLTVGAIPTFFASGLILFLLQVGAFVLRVDISRFVETSADPLATARTIYRFLPPVGNLVFDLKGLFSKSDLLFSQLFTEFHFGGWLLWLAAALLLFRLRINFPSRVGPSES